MHEIVYFAEFGDESGVTYTAPGKLLTPHRDRNKAFGPIVSHVYRKPGTYTVKIWAYEMSSDKRAMWERTYIVGDPDAVFAGSDTAYISTASDWSNAPAGARRYTSLASAWSDRSAQAKTRFMFKAGETHARISQNLDARVNPSPSAHVHFVNDYDRANDADTGYVRPVLDTSGAGGNFGIQLRGHAITDDVVFQGIELRGDWDAAAETGDGAKTGFSFHPSGGSVNNSQSGHALLDDCVITNLGTPLGSFNAATMPDTNLTLHDCVMSDWRSFGIYVAGMETTNLLGCRIAQNVDARSGGDRTDTTRNDHGPVRFDTIDPHDVFVDGCDMFSRSGWFVNTGDYRTQQPCLRGNQAGAAGCLYSVSRSAFEGGLIQLKFTVQNASYGDQINNVVIDQNILVGTHMSNGGIETAGTGVTVRNVLHISPDVPRIDNVFDPDGLVILLPPTNNPNANDAPLNVYNNTVLNLMTDANAVSDASIALIQYVATAPDVTEANNILHQPNQGTPDTDQGPLDATVLWEPREKGYIPSTGLPNAGVLDETYASPADTVQAVSTLSGAGANGAAIGTNPFYDRNGRQRPVVSHAAGAMEPV